MKWGEKEKERENIYKINPLTANEELSRHENLCNTLPSNKLSKNSENPGS